METKRYAGVVVKSSNKVLLCKRSLDKNSFPGTWFIPSGKIEFGESPKQAAKREFYEETSLNIDEENINFIGILPIFSKKHKIKGMMYVYILESSKRLNPNFELAMDGHEHSEWDYFSYEEIEKKEFNIFLKKLLKIVFLK